MRPNWGRHERAFEAFEPRPTYYLTSRSENNKHSLHRQSHTQLHTHFYVLSRTENHTQVWSNVPTFTFIHFLCICMIVACTHMCVIGVVGFGSVWVCMWNFRDNTLHNIYSVFEASNSQQAHCEGVEMHVCDARMCVCLRMCVCVCVLALNIYFDPSKSMFEAAIEIQASRRLSCW